MKRNIKAIPTAVLAAVMCAALAGCAENDAPESRIEYNTSTSSSADSSGKSSSPIVSNIKSDSSSPVPESSKPKGSKGVAKEEDSVFNLPQRYNTEKKPNSDDGIEITAYIYTAPDHQEINKLSEWDNGWENVKSVLNVAELPLDDDTVYEDVVNIKGFDLSPTDKTYEMKTHESKDYPDNQFEYFGIGHTLFDAPEYEPIVYLELVDSTTGTDTIVTDPTLLSESDNKTRVKAITAKTTAFNNPLRSQKTPVLVGFVIKTPENGETEFLIGSSYGGIMRKLKQIGLMPNGNNATSEGIVQNDFYFNNGDLNPSAVVKTSKYTLVLECEGGKNNGIIGSATLIRN